MPNVPFADTWKAAGPLAKRLLSPPSRQPKVTLGLDVGTSAIKVIAAGQRRPGAPRPVLGQHCVPMVGQDGDAPQAVREAIETLQVPTRTVTVGVSGPSVIMRVVELPAMSLTELRQALPFESQRYLPFSIQDVILDGHILGPSEAKKLWVLIVACKKDLIERRQTLLRQAGLDLGVIDVDALALTNAFAASGVSGGEQTAALLNIGAQCSNVVVLRGTTPYLVRDIPWGGSVLVQEVAEHLGEDTATIRTALGAPEVTPALQDALRAVCETVVVELQLSFDYFENQFGRPPEKVFVSGGASLWPALVDALGKHLTQPVVPWSPVAGLSSQFVVAYGLSLRVP